MIADLARTGSIERHPYRRTVSRDNNRRGVAVTHTDSDLAGVGRFGILYSAYYAINAQKR